MDSFFVSTAIPYVNAAPHLGFALEVVLADAIARHARARGDHVCFTSGTDDHSLKNVRAAEQLGLTTRAFVDDAALRYAELEQVLGASYDAFVRTSVDARHGAAVRELWTRCERAGDLERRAYRGLYCAGCEQFYEPSELADGLCVEHQTAPEVVEEENWFFRLSRYASPIRDAIVGGRLRIHPERRALEVLRFLDSGLRDISVSRPRERARGWGIEVPGDPTQVVYVWFDALANYLAAVGFPDDEASVARRWCDAPRRVHVVGKGIARFHAVLWPAILLASGLPLPTDLLVHGYLCVDGKKIGKSLGNGIDPRELASRYGVDGLRWFLLRHVGPANDANISIERIDRAYTSELANGLGNLAARTLTLVRTALGGAIRDVDDVEDDGDRSRKIRALVPAVHDAVDRFALDEALGLVIEVVTATNAHLSLTEPWAIARARDEATDDDERARLDRRLRASLGLALRALRAVARALVPLLPETSRRLSLSLVHPEDPAPILFPRLR
jgi:methionyl-tRNA synthetase